MSTSYEDATRCPKCQEPGNVRQKRPAPKGANLPRGTSIHTVYCVNERCKWFETPWLVQINADGTVPEPKDHRGAQKTYAGVEGHDAEAQRIINALTMQRELETKRGGHGEVRGRGF